MAMATPAGRAGSLKWRPFMRALDAMTEQRITMAEASTRVWTRPLRWSLVARTGPAMRIAKVPAASPRPAVTAAVIGVMDRFLAVWDVHGDPGSTGCPRPRGKTRSGKPGGAPQPRS